MAANRFIIGYVILWLAWDNMVALALTRGGRRSPPPIALGSSMIMFGSALLPVLALACVSYGTPWVPRDLLEMLSLMTPVLLAVFVGNHLRRWGVTGPERPRARHRRGGSTRS